ncbi:MAG: anti-sigma factor family protein [Croceivirga sp.]
MDKEYITTEGLLEKFLLDELGEEENQGIERAIANNRDLKQKFEQLEADFERMAFENAITPPPHIKNILIERLDEKPIRQIRYQWLGAAASLALLFMLTTFWMYSKWQTAQDELNILQNQSVVLEDRLDVLEKNYELTNDRLQLINSPSTIPFVLKGYSVQPKSRAVAYVNHDNPLVVVNPQGLPQLSS